jgi:hypothetical protein
MDVAAVSLFDNSKAQQVDTHLATTKVIVNGRRLVARQRRAASASVMACDANRPPKHTEVVIKPEDPRYTVLHHNWLVVLRQQFQPREVERTDVGAAGVSGAETVRVDEQHVAQPEKEWNGRDVAAS